MGFRQADSQGKGGYARLWSVENKGKYSTARVSTSRKLKDSDTWETDFQDGFVRLVGDAHKKAGELTIPERGIGIQITACEATKTYNAAEKKGYANYIIYAFDVLDAKGGSNNTSKAKQTTKPAAAPAPVDDEDEDLPF